MERLASGLRINRAGDDPAGLGVALGILSGAQVEVPVGVFAVRFVVGHGDRLHLDVEGVEGCGLEGIAGGLPGLHCK